MSRAIAFVAETLRLSAPYAAVALGALVSERAGLVNIGFEATLITSALATALVAHSFQSPLLGVCAALVVGALVGWLHAYLVERRGVHAIVSGTALNMAAVGLSRVVLRYAYQSSSNSPALPGFFWGHLPRHPLLRVLANPLIWLVFLAFFGVAWLLKRTRFGLRLRAVGENPTAARQAAIDGVGVRLAASSLAGALAALGGSHLVMEQHQFSSGMSGGRGFIALAILILGGWKPARTFVAALAFAGLEAGQIALQDTRILPPELVQLLPYGLTLLVLANRRLAASPPRGLGKPVDSVLS